jgi:DNA-binding CsgD family transcriptional regulator
MVVTPRSSALTSSRTARDTTSQCVGRQNEPHVTARAIIGRDEELDSVEAFLAEVREGPRALVLFGEPGIGKTILWSAAVEVASRSFGSVLTCLGVEAEASLSFTALSDLLGGVLDEVMASLAPPRRRALEVALLLADPGGNPPDTHGVGLAVLDVLRALAVRGPVLVALDDVQWLDPASAGVLQIAFRRLRDERIGVLATVRGTPGTSAPLQLDRSFPDDRLTLLSLRPLSLGALHQLLVERTGLRSTRSELVRILELSRGNPFFALELGREMLRTGARAVAGRSLRVPDSLRALLGGRLAQLPAETADVLLEAAALARPTVELVAAAHGDIERVREALGSAVREDLVELDDSRIRFAHPLLSSICYEQSPVWKRRAIHQALAGAVADVEERARHLALAAEGPDAAVAAELDRAAEQAASRGATPAAAELCELAAQLTPDDPPRARGRRMRAAHFHRLAGDSSRAAGILEVLLVQAEAGSERADVLFAKASMMKGDQSTMLKVCDEALAEAGDDDARAARVLALRTWVNILADAHASLADSRRALERAERASDEALLAAVIGRVAQAEVWTVEITPGLLERGAEIEQRLGLAVDYRASPSLYLTRLQMRLGEVDRPRRTLEVMEATAAARGDESTRTLVLWYLSQVDWTAGHLETALEHATAAYERSQQIAISGESSWSGRVKALIETDIGLVDEARASAEEGLAFAIDTSNDIFVILCQATLGRLELVEGNLEAAGGHLRELPARLLAGGWSDPSQPVWADTIETLIALGELEQARSYLDAYAANAERLGSPAAIAGAARCQGLLAAAEGDPDAAFAAFQLSLGELGRITYPLELGRTLLCLGVVRRQGRQKKAAREELEQALAIFEECGARPWAARTRAELERIGGRRPASEALTGTERRVASLAAEGRSNREIAAELFMGVSTVEAHLSHAYRKLGIRSRASLARAIDADARTNAMDEARQT